MKILITDKITQQAKEILEKEEGIIYEEKLDLKEEDLIEIVEPYHALVIRSSVKITPKVVEAAKNLKVIGRAGVGIDNVDLDAATKKGIYVLNTPLGNINSAAEHTVAMILSLSRHIHEAHHSLKREKKWERKSFIGVEVKDKILGVIGFGHVGKIVAEIASQGLKMKAIAFDPFARDEDIIKVGARRVNFKELLKTSDFITVHTPLIPETRNLIDKEEFKKMKKGVKIINVARGGIINEDALYEALKNGKVSGAAIDVWEEEPAVENKLLELPNVLVTPHLGASTIEAQENVARDIALGVINALKNNIYHNVVNKDILRK